MEKVAIINITSFGREFPENLAELQKQICGDHEIWL